MTLQKLINKESIVIVNDSPKTINEAIDLCCSCLVKSGKVTSDYPKAIQESHKKTGPYYVLAPKIAMPHARPEDGVNELSLQLTVFKNGMDFGSKDNGDVYIALTLAAMDSDSHIQTIMTLSELFQNDADIEEIIGADSIEGILEIVSRY